MESEEMIYAVNYDLKKPGQDYAPLYEAIKSCGDWWHYLGSTWLVDTALSADGIWDRLKAHVDANDNADHRRDQGVQWLAPAGRLRLDQRKAQPGRMMEIGPPYLCGPRSF
jgi:hypothetical protein